MRTAELINLLRSKDRTSPAAKAELAALDPTRFLHLLGELSKWLQVDITKYQNHRRPEYRPQAAIRSQIKQTLVAINIVLDSAGVVSSGPTFSASGVRTAKTAIPLDDAQKESILEDFLTPLLISIAPLSRDSDTQDVQLMSAKILCFCTNARSKNTPFPPQDVARKMMTIQSRKPGDGPSTRTSHAIVGLLALLRSPLIKLQDYGLRILLSHRFLVELEPTWQVIAPLTEILESIRDKLITLAADNSSHSQGSDTAIDLEPTETGRSDLDGAHISQELETTLGIQTKAMSLLQNFLQVAGEKKASQTAFVNAANSQDQSLEPGNLGKKRSFLTEALRDNPDIVLLLDLWRTLQLIALFSRARSPAVERLVLVTSATIYWSCWVFQDHVVSYIMAAGADTLLAWYGYYITSHTDPAVALDSTTPLVPQQLPSAADISSQKEAFRNRCLVLEYITKLIFNICSAKKHREALFSGPGPVGIVIMRRTLEFLENMLESSLPMVDSSSPEWDEPIADGGTAKVVTYALEAIQVRIGILEAMLGILSACMGASREGDDLVLQGRLLNLLVLLMSDMEQLLGIEIKDSAEQRIRNHTFNLLRSILHSDSALMAIDDVTMDQWTLGYTSLVDMIMQPLERWDRSSVYPPFGDHEAKEWMKQGEHQVKVLRIFKLFWKQHPKGRSMLSELFGPRFYRLPMIEALMGPECRDGTSEEAKWAKMRTVYLVETMVYFGVEAGVRINMRERWSSLLFITMLLGTSVKRLEACGYSAKEKLCREIARACLTALRNFWYDRQSLEQLADLDSTSVDIDFWRSHMPATVVGSDVASPISIVPLLLTIIAPPGTTWSSELVLGSVNSKGRPRKRRRHVLLDNQDPLLSEAAWLLSVLARFPGCQQHLISKSGAIWILSRLMVERLLVNLHGPPPTDKDEGDMQMDSAEAVHSSLEKALLITLRRIMSAVDLAKAIVSNNTITELFAAILEMDRPLTFYSSKLVCDVSEADSSRDQILPTPSQHELHVQLLLQFRSAMQPLKGQFERVYQYVGGHRSFQDADETSESVYWLREYCALVFLYASEPPSRASSVTSWMSKVDKTALLNSESIFGVACRMLTLEMDYDNAEEVNSTHEDDDNRDNQRPSTTQEREDLRAQKEAAQMRRFSAALAIQSLSWRKGPWWRLLHQNLRRSYRNVLTTEREAYIQMLKAEGDRAATIGTAESLLEEHRLPVTFLVQDRVIAFNDRLVLARSSEFFYHLLLGQFKETGQNQIRIRDVEADDFEMLLEVVGESLLTAQHVLPEDLPLSMVLRLMACAERFMVVYIRRLAEAWILNTLQTREMKYYRLQAQSAMDTEASVTESLRRTREESPQAELVKRMRFDGGDGLTTVLEDILPSEEDEDEDEEEVEQGRYLNPEAEEEPAHESIQECLLMVFEVCSDPRHGDIHAPEHPFYELVWDVLRRMVLRLGPVALEPRFAAMLEQGGEERIQEFLQMLFELVVD